MIWNALKMGGPKPGYLMERDDPVFVDTYSDGRPLVFSLGTEPEAGLWSQFQGKLQDN